MDASPIAPPRSATMARRVVHLIIILIAAACVLVADTMLRGRQRLVASIASHDAPSLLPFSDFLAEQISRKTEWNDMLAKLDAARAKDNRDEFIKTTYALTKFASSNLGAEDWRRQKFLLDLVARYPDDPQVIPAYIDLFEPAWKSELRSSYPKYTDALLKLAPSQNTGSADLLANVASILHDRGEPELELRMLRKLRETQPVNVMTAPSMRRLVALLPTSDADHSKLESELATFDRHQIALLASAKWYSDFETARAKGDVKAAEELRRAAPVSAGETNAFVASADAHLAQLYQSRGQIDEARRLRASLAPLKTSEDDFDPKLLMTMLPSFESPMRPGGKSPAGKPSEMLTMPDVWAIRLEQWRGLLEAGRFDDAANTANQAFAESKEMLAAANAEIAIARGDFSQLQPQAKLEPVTSASPPGAEAPPQIANQPNLCHATLELHPAGAAVPAEIKSHLDLWVSDKLIVADFWADEPRSNPPKPKMTQRDADVFKDECVELFFNPSRWLDAFYQIDVNAAGALYDSKHTSPGGMKPQFAADKKFNLDNATATPLTRPGGWGVRIIMPRDPLLPPGARVARFNVRRFRYIEEAKAPVLQLYTWAPMKDGSHHPELFGWIILPESNAGATK